MQITINSEEFLIPGSLTFNQYVDVHSFFVKNKEKMETRQLKEKSLKQTTSFLLLGEAIAECVGDNWTVDIQHENGIVEAFFIYDQYFAPLLEEMKQKYRYPFLKNLSKKEVFKISKLIVFKILNPDARLKISKINRWWPGGSGK